jgi:two-component system OmpR family sensor kinase
LSVLKSWDIDLPQSEKLTLYRFLALYTLLSLIILALTTNLYIMLQKETKVKENVIMLNDYTNELTMRLKEYRGEKSQAEVVLNNPHFEVSLYDESFDLLATTAQEPKPRLDEIVYTEDTIIRYLAKASDHYLMTKYFVIKIKQDGKWLEQSYQQMLIYGSLFFVFMIIVGYFLLTLFLKPMTDALYLLDRFIKDTTHELNTPVSTIMTNIEMVDPTTLSDAQSRAVNRIELGAKTISNIYDDLTYLVLHHKIVSQNQEVDMNQLIKDRVEYISALASIKKVEITTQLHEEVRLSIDPNKIAKVVDNLLSNALKYNRVGGSVEITLESDALSIKDSGRGIKPEHLSSLFDRYARFDKSAGGFGIGLSIVKLICDEYHIAIDVSSKVDVGTQVRLSWSG